MRKKEHSGSAAVIGAQLVILFNFDGFPVRSEQKSGGGEYICGDGEER